MKVNSLTCHTNWREILQSDWLPLRHLFAERVYWIYLWDCHIHYIFRSLYYCTKDWLYLSLVLYFTCHTSHTMWIQKLFLMKEVSHQTSKPLRAFNLNMNFCLGAQILESYVQPATGPWFTVGNEWKQNISHTDSYQYLQLKLKDLM